MNVVVVVFDDDEYDDGDCSDKWDLFIVSTIYLD